MDIYVNIWGSYGGYEGRLVICEIDSLWNRDSLYPQNIWRKWYVLFWENGLWKTLYKRALK